MHIRHPKPPSVSLIRLRIPHPGLVTVTAPAGLFRAIGMPARHADHLPHIVTVTQSEGDRIVVQLTAEVMAQSIVAEVRRTGGFCDHAALRRRGWPQRVIDRLGGLARDMAGPRVAAANKAAA